MAIQLRRTDAFTHWIDRLRDQRAVVRIGDRLRRLAVGNPGLCRTVGHGVSELKIDYGPGYRVYFTKRGQQIVLLLCGGDKSSQKTDIKLAHRLADQWKEQSDGT
jgi:putative addiction module killer protein